MNADDIFKAHGIPVVYSFYPVDRCPLYVDAPFELMLFRGQKESDTLKGDFMLAVSEYVQHEMFNEYVDESQPLYRLVIKDLNNYITWQNDYAHPDIQLKEFSVYADKEKSQKIGKLTILVGGFYKENPYQWMSKCTDSYLLRQRTLVPNFKQALNMVEATMDNSWTRVILLSSLNLDNLIYTSKNGK